MYLASSRERSVLSALMSRPKIAISLLASRFSAGPDAIARGFESFFGVLSLPLKLRPHGRSLP